MFSATPYSIYPYPQLVEPGSGMLQCSNLVRCYRYSCTPVVDAMLNDNDITSRTMSSYLLSSLISADQYCREHEEIKVKARLLIRNSESLRCGLHCKYVDFNTESEKSVFAVHPFVRVFAYNGDEIILKSCKMRLRLTLSIDISNHWLIAFVIIFVKNKNWSV